MHYSISQKNPYKDIKRITVVTEISEVVLVHIRFWSNFWESY